MKIAKESRSIQNRLIGLMVCILAVTLLINLFMMSRINTMVREIDSVFASNVSMDELSETIEQVQNSVYDYLNTKSSSALENYYRYTQNFQELLDKMNHENVDNEALMLAKNIRSMSESYIEKTDETIKAKRGRNVERYREYYEEGLKLFNFINYEIYRLDNIYFTNNSANYEELLGIMSILRKCSAAVIFGVFVTFLILIVSMIRAMVDPLRKLSSAALEVAEGNLDVEIPEVQTEDEIGIVTSAFDAMLKSIREYIVQVRESTLNEARMKEQELELEAHLKEAQLRFLQAQINPHFLFNSLNAGAQLAMLEDAENTGTFLEKMAEFFRYNVKKNNGISTIREEIESIDNYIYILNVRFAGDITYEKDVDEDTCSLVMPGLVLQPIVENAVAHGIHDMLEDGIITLHVVKEEEYVRVTVRDNGVGMTKEQIAAVMEERMSDERSSHSSGIGLNNVMNRLKLYYGREGLFLITSDGMNCGTEVTVLLPYERA